LFSYFPTRQQSVANFELVGMQLIRRCLTENDATTIYRKNRHKRSISLLTTG